MSDVTQKKVALVIGAGGLKCAAALGVWQVLGLVFALGTVLLVKRLDRV